MKKVILLLVLLSPITVMAHQGHGISGSELIHLFISHYYVAIAFALAIGGGIYFRNRIKIRS